MRGDDEKLPAEATNNRNKSSRYGGNDQTVKLWTH